MLSVRSPKLSFPSDEFCTQALGTKDGADGRATCTPSWQIDDRLGLLVHEWERDFAFPILLLTHLRHRYMSR